MTPHNSVVCLYPNSPKFNHIQTTCTGCDKVTILYTDVDGISYLQSLGRYMTRVSWNVPEKIEMLKLELDGAEIEDFDSFLEKFHQWVEGVSPSDFVR